MKKVASHYLITVGELIPSKYPTLRTHTVLFFVLQKNTLFTLNGENVQLHIFNSTPLPPTVFTRPLTRCYFVCCRNIGPVSLNISKIEALQQCASELLYTSDFPVERSALIAAPVLTTVPNGRIKYARCCFSLACLFCVCFSF